ncbi:SPFH domain-containing protein [Enterococcus sp. HY326]|uniref:SPFH domain-containing protein n=1 Tax=Enterococcus sp. HY326 TaxID=2971265 RepID=UPI00224042E0|nr:SPFH domain-containing protein [Enterococcus sp. HY326]
MGLIKAATSTIGGGLADQWLEVIEPAELTESTLVTTGVQVRQDSKRGSNRKGTEGVITDGSVVHVYPNTMMLLVDGGRVIDYTAEEGYYTIKNELAPSMFNGDLKDAISETFSRFKFGGTTPQKQQVIYINLQEIKGIKFGTATPINYFDNFYNAELFLRAHGTYSIKVTDPILFYANAISKSAPQMDVKDINEQYMAEFLTALQAAINQMSADGQRISYIPSKSMELSQYMADVLDKSWHELRGLEIVSVAVASISYTDDSTRLINMRNEGAMLGDPGIREGYVQGSVARGIENAGKNPSGSGSAFMGVGMGMNMGGDYLSQASKNNQEAAQNQQAHQHNQTGEQASSDDATWTCPNCQTENTGNFCTNCGTPKPQPKAAVKLEMRCSECHEIVDLTNGIPKFCPHCGKPFVGIPVE